MNFPSEDKTVLEGGNDVREEGFKAVHKDFGGDFVDGIAEADGSEVADFERVVDFGNEGNKRVVYFFEDFPFVEESQNDRCEIVSNVAPRVLVEFCGEAIGSWGFPFWHLKKGFLDLDSGERFIEFVDVVVVEGSFEVVKESGGGSIDKRILFGSQTRGVKEVKKMGPTKILNFGFFSDNVVVRVHELENGVPPGLVACVGVEEFGVKVSISDATDLGSNRPELFFRVEEVVKLVSDSDVSDLGTLFFRR